MVLTNAEGSPFNPFFSLHWEDQYTRLGNFLSVSNIRYNEVLKKIPKEYVFSYPRICTCYLSNPTLTSAQKKALSEWDLVSTSFAMLFN